MSLSGLGGNLADFDRRTSPVRELIWPSVLGEPLVYCLQEPMPGKKSLEYAIQATASVWKPFERVRSVVSGDVDFDSFGMAPWDAGGMHSRTRSEVLQTMMVQWLMWLLCRPVIMHEFAAGRVFRRAERRLYMARPVDWAVSMQSTSDWVTRFRIFPETWTMLSMAGSPPCSRERECGSSAVSSSYPVG